MEKKILEFLEQVADIPYWDRAPGIDDTALNEMINYLKEKKERN